MPTEKVEKETPDLEVFIDIDENDENILVEFKTDERTIKIGFSLQEAQLFQHALGEKIGEVMLRKLQLFPHQSENVH
mgnify:CR=1 FL=1